MSIQEQDYVANLEQLAASYTYDADSFARLYARLAEKVAAFPLFGDDLTRHLGNACHHTKNFMGELGYDAETATKVSHAFALHDIGKIKQDPELWRITEEKRVFTPEQKAERPRHAILGLDVLDETIAEIGMVPDADQQAHIKLVKHLMKFHHERLDGTGPQSLQAPAQDRILRICAIVDTVDGKFKAKSLSEIFEDMSGAKHVGQFDAPLVAAYAGYYGSSRPAAGGMTAVLAKPARSL